MKKKALITGVTGQDGAYLSEFLLNKGYEVIGTSRKIVSNYNWRLKQLKINKDVKILKIDSLDENKIRNIIRHESLDEIYNLSGISSVSDSFKNPIKTFKANTINCLQILNSIYEVNKKIKFYQASSSEMFGSKNIKCNENSSFDPLSPYAISKLSAYQITVNYRENYNLHASNGILFNHESPLRGKDFVSKKIISGLLNFKRNKRGVLKLGNIYAKRDWGHAKDFVNAMYLMLQKNKPGDYVISTGLNISVKEMINIACKLIGIEGKWIGRGLNEYYLLEDKKIIEIDKKLFRPLDIKYISGDSRKAKTKLNWSPSYNIEMIINEMIEKEKYSKLN